MTTHPTAAWIWRQMIEATPWGRQPSSLIHDRDRMYGADFASRLAGLGVKRHPHTHPSASSERHR